ncbi:hypothetical protein WBG06_02875 [Nocardioides sp. CCNWLW239]|uniref:hypothetical protein n=1 Tax=Nocardioides sp. CCNWLW239 TaxID=3128902 RepID=UPI0030175481
MTSDGADALAFLNSWFEARGRDTSASTLDAWSISKHKDARVFSPRGGRRTNRLHMVRDGLVVAYSPSTESTEAAYARMTLEAADTREDCSVISETEALATLNAWFASHGSDVSGSTPEVWNTWRVHDAWGFGPVAGRTNRLYLVRDLTVVSYAPTSESDEEAYARLDCDPNPPGLSEPKPVMIAGAMPLDLDDGLHYYIEERTPPFELGPMVYKVEVKCGLADATYWDPQDRCWKPSRRLEPYRTGRGEERLYSTTAQEAERWRQNRQERWETANRKATSPNAAPETDQANALLKELQSFPGWSGISFRGMSTTAEFGKAARTAVARGLVATSRDSRVATQNFTTPGVYAVMGTEGRGIESVSRRPKEFEVLFLPGTAFGVVGTIDVDGYPVILVRQTKLSAENPDIDMTDFETRARNAVASGRAGAQVPITSPGKYVGDID